jgi:hypothetical protein
MSEKLESHGEDIPMENLEPPRKLPPAAKTAHSRVPRLGGSIKREDIRDLFEDPEYTVWDVYNNEAKKVDRELVNDWKESLNSLLLFVSNALHLTHIY